MIVRPVSITFPDVKSTFTKDVLMRIDLRKLSQLLSLGSLEIEIEEFNRKYDLNISTLNWPAYQKQIAPVQRAQIELFV